MFLKRSVLGSNGCAFMSGIAGAPPPPSVVLGMGISGPWYPRSTTPLRRSEKTPLRLPSLGLPTAAPGGKRGINMTRLSLSEPSLHHTKDITSFEAFCCVRPLHSSKSLTHSKVHPPPATSHTHKDFPSFQPTYIHLSQAIRLNSKPRPARPRSRMLATTGDLGPFGPLGSFGPLAMRSHNMEMLSVIGKPCVLNCNQRTVMGPVRPQLHVFLPAEEETDTKSLDEGFMDESEAKMASLRLRKEDSNQLEDVHARRADSVLGLLNH